MSNPHREMTIAEESAPERAWRVLPVSVTPDYSSGPKCPWCGAEGLSHGLFRWTRVKRGRYCCGRRRFFFFGAFVCPSTLAHCHADCCECGRHWLERVPQVQEPKGTVSAS